MTRKAIATIFLLFLTVGARVSFARDTESFHKLSHEILETMQSFCLGQLTIYCIGTIVMDQSNKF